MHPVPDFKLYFIAFCFHIMYALLCDGTESGKQGNFFITVHMTINGLNLDLMCFEYLQGHYINPINYYYYYYYYYYKLF